MADTTRNHTAKVKKRRGPGRPFLKGQSGNPKGRPPGTKNKLCESFIDACFRKWAEGGDAALDTMMREDPVAFCQMIAKLVPKEYQMTPDTADSFAKVWEFIGAQQDKAADDQEG
jgi:hypothetical protein